MHALLSGTSVLCLILYIWRHISKLISSIFSSLKKQISNSHNHSMISNNCSSISNNPLRMILNKRPSLKSNNSPINYRRSNISQLPRKRAKSNVLKSWGALEMCLDRNIKRKCHFSMQIKNSSNSNDKTSDLEQFRETGRILI